MRRLQLLAAVLVVCISLFYSVPRIIATVSADRAFTIAGGAIAHRAIAHDVSPALSTLARDLGPDPFQDYDVDRPSTVLSPSRDADVVDKPAPRAVPVIRSPPGSAAVEQTTQGAQAPAELVASFDGLGVGFDGPQGSAMLRNPSDNTLAVGPNHIIEIVNSRMAIFTKKGRQFDTTGKVLYGAVPTNSVFKGFGGPCEMRNNGDAVVRYDQLADRWLIVMPIFSRSPATAGAPPPPKAGQPSRGRGRPRAPQQTGAYAMCYALSTSPDPFGSYYRYEFIRPLFPDYPRPTVWPDGYYLPTSTGDEVLQKHACVVERAKMLQGKDAAEQCVIVDDVNFLNNADLDGKTLPPQGAANIVLAGGGTQLRGEMEDDGIYAWNFHVDWNDPAKTSLTGPSKIAVAPYHYLCDGQLTNCVPQPGTKRRLDAQGDKLMARVVYRRIGGREMVVAVHSVNTNLGAGGVRWYELSVEKNRALSLRQQGTYAPDSSFRWMASPAIDKFGNIGIGYSFGGSPRFAGQRFAARLADDPLGVLSLREAVLVDGEGAQTNTLRWEDYSQTAVDPSDDCTIWYVGDYYKKGAPSYSTRIGAFRMPQCR